MTIVELLILLAIAGVCGAVGQSIAGITRGGCLAAVALGFIGALLGRWLAGALELPLVFPVSVGGAVFPVLWSVIGAALFVAVLGALMRGGGGSGR